MLTYTWMWLSMLLPAAAGILIAAGSATRGIGAGLLALAVLVIAVSPILKAQIRRRSERRASAPNR